MERNPNDMGSTPDEGGMTDGTTGSYGSGSVGASPSGMGGGSAPLNTGVAGTAPLADSFATTSQGSTSQGSTSQGAMGDEEAQRRAGQLREGAQQRASQAREALGTAGTKARDLKQSLEQTLAEKLESGANRLRSRGTESAAGTSGAPGTPAYAGSGGMGATAARSPAQSERVADGMEATAKWLREGDIKSSVEEQARTNPGRTLLVALGVGYLLGKALKR